MPSNTAEYYRAWRAKNKTREAGYRLKRRERHRVVTIAELVEKLQRYPSEMLIAVRDECESDGEYETITIEHRVGDSEIIMVIQ